jgi:anti-anti-sigma factor
MSSAPPPFTAEVVDDGGDRRLVITGELDVAAAPTLQAALAEAGAGTPIDARGITFCDSTGLSRLINAARRSEEAGRRLTIIASASLRRTIDLASISSCFDLPEAGD